MGSLRGVRPLPSRPHSAYGLDRMTTLQFIVMVAGFVAQMGGLAFLGVLVYRQGHRVTPGEAAIFLEMRKLLEQ